MVGLLVRHEEIAGSVHRNNIRGHSGNDGELLTASRRKLHHAIVARVRDEQVATCVHRQAGRTIEAGSGDGPQLAAATLKYLIAVGTREEDTTLFIRGDSRWGLWPLCHVAHTRPIFRGEDWNYYQAVNLKFADALLDEMKNVEKPIVRVQDYHFALLPRLIKEKRPEARVAIFWHIPWPAPQAFDISPLRRELVDGLLGADLIGFHIQSHCNNFLQTVDRVLEARVDWEHFSVRRLDHLTLVRPFPISVDFTGVQQPESTPDSYVQRCRLSSREKFFECFARTGIYTPGTMLPNCPGC